ncbi:MAG: hypothetical protein OXG90_03575 [Gammaproteobacteria bacterium]|nr:hypothetical protein [Gammaproteobacteria bacterium]
MTSRNSTLINLAILKVDLDEGGRKYLDNFIELTANLLRKNIPDPINPSNVALLFEAEYGLRVPEQGVQLVLKRLKRKGYLKLENNCYEIIKELPAIDLHKKEAIAQKHIELVYKELKEFAKENYSVEWNDIDVDQAILGFLGRFSVECIRAYVFSTALPESPKKDSKDQFIVSKFIQKSYEERGEIFSSIIVLIKGQMYANALICTDLESIEKDFRKVTFFFDTPVVLSAIGIQSQANTAATKELMTLLQNLKGKLAVFDHLVEEIENVLQFAETNIDNPEFNNRTIRHFRDSRTGKSDIAIFRNHIEEHIRNAGLNIYKTPRHVRAYQIDEVGLEKKLKDGLNHKGTSGSKYDTESVRSIFTLRKGSIPKRLEDCASVLITDNSKFARIAFEHGKEQNSSREVSTVITDYSLASVAWLKAPLGSPSLPEKELIAACYAALEPSIPLWDKYLSELNSLEQRREIGVDDLIVLRSHGIAANELMEVTLGDEAALVEGSMRQIHGRVQAALVEKQLEKLSKVEEDRQALADKNKSMEKQSDETKAKLYWVSNFVAGILTIVFLIVALFAIGLAAFQSAVLTAPWVQNSEILASIANGAIILGTCWFILQAYNRKDLRGLAAAIRRTICLKVYKILVSWLFPDNT